MLTSALAKTRRPIATASQSSFNRAFSAIGSETFIATSDIRITSARKVKQNHGRAFAHRPGRAGNPASSIQYDGETEMAAISQNFFVGRFATRPFSKYTPG